MCSRASALECDVNLHKSNSTFLSDMDVSRAALLTTLFHAGLRRLRPSGKGARVHFVLVAVQVSFHRQILPYQAYEVHSRIVGWDGKWIYVGNWFVRPGTAARQMMLQRHAEGVDLTVDSLNIEKARKEVFASAVPKYVFKQGRLTIAPVRMFEEAGFLPKSGGDAMDGKSNVSSQDGGAEWSILEDLERMRLNGLRYAKTFME